MKLFNIFKETEMGPEITEITYDASLGRGKLSPGPALGRSKLSKILKRIELNINFLRKLLIIYPIHGVMKLQNERS